MEQLPIETTIYSLSDKAPPANDRRADERHLTLFRVGSIAIGTRRELCLVKNVSAGGALIRAYCVLEPGRQVEIELREGQPVKADVKWVRGTDVGLDFKTPVDVVDLLKNSGDGPRPRMPRVEVDCVAWVRVDATVHRSRAVNISQGGIKVECRSNIPTGTDVIVTLNGLPPCQGTIRWSVDGACGVTFNRILALPVLVAWLHGQRDRLRATG